MLTAYDAFFNAVLLFAISIFKLIVWAFHLPNHLHQHYIHQSQVLSGLHLDLVSNIIVLLIVKVSFLTLHLSTSKNHFHHHKTKWSEVLRKKCIHQSQVHKKNKIVLTGLRPPYLSYICYIFTGPRSSEKNKSIPWPQAQVSIFITCIIYLPVPGPQWSKFPSPWQRPDRQQCTPPTIALITMLMFSKTNIRCKILFVTNVYLYIA